MDLITDREVDFTALSLHFDSQGMLWCKLVDSMLLAFCPSSGTSMEPFGDEGFRGVCWSGNEAFLVRHDNFIIRFDLATQKWTELAKVVGAHGPIVVNVDQGWCAFELGGNVKQISFDGAALADYEIDFRPMSLL